jgi:pentatricopeptide repeat protein
MKANKKLKPQSVSIYIVSMGKAGQHIRALRSYKDLTDPDIKQNKFVCNTLLKVLSRAAYVEKAFQLFEDMKAEGFIPDVYSYSIVRPLVLISHCKYRS